MIAAFLLWVTAPHLLAQSSEFTILLDPVIKSERVELHYILQGGFGGYGNGFEKMPGLNAIRIPTMVSDAPANAIKLFIWAPGCRMAAFQIYFLKPESVERSYVCVPLSTTTLIGKVPKALLTPASEVVVTYLASWACDFFGLKDCMVPHIVLPTVRPDADGTFRLELPDFSADPIASQSVGGAEWHVHLRGKTTSVIEPQNEAFRSPAHGLKIAPSYQENLVFVIVNPSAPNQQ